jgi:hypothetical protein
VILALSSAASFTKVADAVCAFAAPLKADTPATTAASRPRHPNLVVISAPSEKRASF